MSNNLYVPEEVELKTLLDVVRKLSWAAADVLMAYARGEEPPYGFSCLLYTSPSPRDLSTSRMPSSA